MRIRTMNLVAAEVTRRKRLEFKKIRLLTSAATKERFMEGVLACRRAGRPAAAFFLPAITKIRAAGRRPLRQAETPAATFIRSECLQQFQHLAIEFISF